MVIHQTALTVKEPVLLNTTINTTTVPPTRDRETTGMETDLIRDREQGIMQEDLSSRDKDLTERALQDPKVPDMTITRVETDLTRDRELTIIRDLIRDKDLTEKALQEHRVRIQDTVKADRITRIVLTITIVLKVSLISKGRVLEKVPDRMTEAVTIRVITTTEQAETDLIIIMAEAVLIIMVETDLIITTVETALIIMAETGPITIMELVETDLITTMGQVETDLITTMAETVLITTTGQAETDLIITMEQAETDLITTMAEAVPIIITEADRGNLTVTMTDRAALTIITDLTMVADKDRRAAVMVSDPVEIIRADPAEINPMTDLAA